MKSHIFQLVITLFLKNTPDRLILKTRLARLLVVSVFKFFRFLARKLQICAFVWLHFHSAPFFCQRTHLAPFLEWIAVSAKLRTGLNVQKRMSMNRSLVYTVAVNAWTANPETNQGVFHEFKASYEIFSEQIGIRTFDRCFMKIEGKILSQV